MNPAPAGRDASPETVSKLKNGFKKHHKNTLAENKNAPYRK